jgi:hypothetical protein
VSDGTVPSSRLSRLLHTSLPFYFLLGLCTMITRATQIHQELYFLLSISAASSIKQGVCPWVWVIVFVSTMTVDPTTLSENWQEYSSIGCCRELERFWFGGIWIENFDCAPYPLLCLPFLTSVSFSTFPGSVCRILYPYQNIHEPSVNSCFETQFFVCFVISLLIPPPPQNPFKNNEVFGQCFFVSS